MSPEKKKRLEEKGYTFPRSQDRFKVGDIVRHRFQPNRLKRGRVTEIEEGINGLIGVYFCIQGSGHFVDTDLEHVK